VANQILVLGATGPTGRIVVARALELGHAVTVLVRSPERLEARPEQVRVITGSLPDDEEALIAAFRGQDAVISALGVGRSFTPNDLMARSVPLIVRAMESQGVRRLVFTSAFGVGSTWTDTPLLPRPHPRCSGASAADRPPASRPSRGARWTGHSSIRSASRMAPHRSVRQGHLTLRLHDRCADLAEFLLTQIDDRSFIGKRVLVAS
jgi:hypothetical protein